MTEGEKALEFKHAHITGQAMRDHWGPIVDRIAAETADWRDAWIYDLITENERLRNAMVVMDNTVRELTEALREMFEAVCGETGFAQAVRAESGIPYPWPALDLAEAMARAALKEIEAGEPFK